MKKRNTPYDYREIQRTLQTPLAMSTIGAVYFMLAFLIIVGSIVLLFLCAWLILLILMQKPSANAGMGAALGGGAAESAFGGEASNVLTRWTVYGVIGFFVLTLSLSLGQIYRHHHDDSKKELAPMAEEVVETPKSLTELPAEGGKAKATEKAGSKNMKANETSKKETSKTDVAKSTASDTSEQSSSATDNSTSKASDTAAKVDTSKKSSKSKISYRSGTKKNAKRKSASSGKSGSKSAEAKGEASR